MDKDFVTLSDYNKTTEEIPIGFNLVGPSNTLFHTHDYVEIFYIISGTINHKYENEPMESLSSGDAFIILPTKKHMFGTGDTSIIHRDIFIRKSFFREVCDFISPTLYDDLLSGVLPCHAIFKQTDVSYLESQISFINQILPGALLQKNAILKCFAYTLLTPFLFKPAEDHIHNFPAWFKQLLENFNKPEYIKEGLDKILSNVNYDRKYLCRVFKKNTGITMTEYLKKIRLDYALSMIQNSNKNILSIAQELGFSSISYFNVSFKNHFGITPIQARKFK